MENVGEGYSRLSKRSCGVCVISILSVWRGVEVFTGVTRSEVGTESPCSTEAVTSSVVTVGSDLMEALSPFMGELWFDRIFL